MTIQEAKELAAKGLGHHSFSQAREGANAIGMERLMTHAMEHYAHAKWEELKNCPKLVQDYVKLLKQRNARLMDLTDKAISKLKHLACSVCWL